MLGATGVTIGLTEDVDVISIATGLGTDITIDVLRTGKDATCVDGEGIDTVVTGTDNVVMTSPVDDATAPSSDAVSSTVVVSLPGNDNFITFFFKHTLTCALVK